MVTEQQSYAQLRNSIAGIIESLEVWTSLMNVCDSLGLQTFENNNGLGKSRYLTEVVTRTTDRQILLAAEKILVKYPGLRGKPSEEQLHKMQDAIWWIKSQGVQHISNVTRYSIAERLEGVRFWGRLNLTEFLVSAQLSNVNCSSIRIGEDGSLYQNLATITFAEWFSSFSESISKPPLWKK